MPATAARGEGTESASKQCSIRSVLAVLNVDINYNDIMWHFAPRSRLKINRVIESGVVEWREALNIAESVCTRNENSISTMFRAERIVAQIDISELP